MITLHHLNDSRSQRVLWLLEELGLAYEIVRYQRDAKTMLAPPALVAIHPPEITLRDTAQLFEHDKGFGVHRLHHSNHRIHVAVGDDRRHRADLPLSALPVGLGCAEARLADGDGDLVRVAR